MASKHKRRRGKVKIRLKRRAAPGSAPGTLVADPGAPVPQIRVMAYGPDGLEEASIARASDVTGWVGRRRVVWINVEGLGDADAVRTLGEIFKLHPLALEDVLNTHQRPKVERYGEELFVVARELRLNDRLESEQFSLFLGPGFVLSFDEKQGDVFDPVRERIRRSSGRLRERGADFLAYALIDALIDSYFPMLETFGDRLEGIEDRIISRSRREDLAALHDAKRDLLMFRRAVWPTREALAGLTREEHSVIAPDTRVFLRDCYDHSVQIIDLIETYREVCSDLADLYLSSASHRLSEVMKLLAIISTIFIPLTFLAGVYGMNFDRGSGPLSMPELGWRHGYLVFWIVSVVIASALLALFWRLGWIGAGPKAARSGEAER